LKVEFILETSADMSDPNYWNIISPIFNGYVHGYSKHNYKEMLTWKDEAENYHLSNHIKRIEKFLIRMTKW
jgi:hypothetical protein